MLTEYLQKEKIILNLHAHNFRQTLVKMLAKSNSKNRNQVLNTLIQRESLMCTKLGKGVAVPRLVTDEIKRTELIVALSRKGIGMKSFDRMPVRIVILHLFAPADDHAAILAQSLRLLNEESLRTELLKSKTADDVIAAIKKWEEE